MLVLTVAGATWSRMASTVMPASIPPRRQQVPGHGLGGTDRHLVRMLAERALDRHGLRPVAHIVDVPCALM